MKSSTNSDFSSSLLFFFIVATFINVVYSEDAASIVVDSETATCSFEMIVLTEDNANAGTDSRISVTLGNSAGQRVRISDLKEWGTMPPGHDYFEPGNEDKFRVSNSVCFDANAPVCNIIVTSDGSGQKPGWLLGDVYVGHDDNTMHDPVNFEFNQWLAKDEPPYKLMASVNNCF